MKTEAQRIAIAKACGIVKQPNSWGGVRSSTAEFVTIPNYPCDLNAMHEAEKVLTYDQAVYYCSLVASITGQKQRNSPIEGAAVHATAAQRAEAFLRALNLWTDEPPSEI